MSDARRTTVVVGTGPAIGRACALAVAAKGDQVVCLDRDLTAAEATRDAVIDAGGQAWAIEVDVTDRSSVKAALSKAAADAGSLGALVNVVGGSGWYSSSDMSQGEWDQQISLNLTQQWVVFQEALSYLRQSSGERAIVSIASVSGLMGSPRHGAYGVAKAGLINLVQTLAIELAAERIRVNAVAPGAIDTPARSGDDHLAARIPLGRRGHPHEIGAAVAFLASPEAGYITGQVLVVDGGVGVKHSLIDL